MALLTLAALLVTCLVSADPDPVPLSSDLAALKILTDACLDPLALHNRVRRNLKELGAHGHHHGHDHGPDHAHGDHAHGDHAHDHGDHAHDHGEHAHDHGDHAHDHGEHAHDHGDHAHDHGEHGHGAGANDELSVWTLITQTDRYGCVAKFTCLLEVKENNGSMTEQEQTVYKYITKPPKEEQLQEMSVLKAPYYFAAYVGDKFGIDMCSKFFPDCRHDFSEMLNFVNKFDIVDTAGR